jgi:hypothetical protein
MIHYEKECEYIYIFFKKKKTFHHTYKGKDPNQNLFY